MPSYLGIDIGGTNLKVAVVSEKGVVQAFRSEPWSGGSPETAVAHLTQLANTIFSECHPEQLSACGAGCAGLVDQAAGVVRSSPNLPAWRDVELMARLERAFDLPTVIDNDANAAGYAECVIGAARGARHAVVLTLGTGIGGGIIVDGRIYHGASGFAGEVGHMVIARDGSPCACGGSGCLETLASAGSLVARATDLVKAGAASELAAAVESGTLESLDVGEAARRGDPVALKAVHAVGLALGTGLANIVQILDPEIIVLGGGVAAAGEPLMAAARVALSAQVAGRRGRLPKLEFARAGEAAGVIGASLIARDEFAGPAGS